MAGNPLIIPFSATERNWSFKDLVSLVKGHLSLYIALTAVAGHALAHNSVSYAGIGLGGWVLALSCGAGVLNNIQDRFHDRRYQRTRGRVLARGDMQILWALGMGACLVLAGLTGLAVSYSSLWPAVLGGTAVVCYNGIYTPLKKGGDTARLRAMVPGTLCGMLPPVIGWTAVEKGLAVTDPGGLMILITGLGVWQFPHFLLVFLKEKEEQKCLKKTVVGSQLYPEREYRVQVVIWSTLFSISMVLFSLWGWLVSPSMSLILFSLSVSLPLFMSAILLRKNQWGRSLDLGFWALNLAMLAYLVIILLDRA